MALLPPDILNHMVEKLCKKVEQDVLREYRMRSKLEIAQITIDGVKQSYENGLAIGPKLPAYFEPVSFWIELPSLPPDYIPEMWGADLFDDIGMAHCCCRHLLRSVEMQERYSKAIRKPKAWVLVQPAVMCRPCPLCEVEKGQMKLEVLNRSLLRY